jgi:hypothetical protein
MKNGLGSCPVMGSGTGTIESSGSTVMESIS